MTKDIVSFANTYGGYLVYGIENETFNIKGVTEKVSKFLSDSNRIIQKVNRFIQPPITNLRSKQKVNDGKNLVFVHIPESRGVTHIVVKEGSYKYPSGKQKVILRPGMIFIRRSGSSQVIEPTDFERLIERRIDLYKKDLLSKIARVVEAPSENQLLMFDPGTMDEKSNKLKIKISSAPDAYPISGLSFTATPETDEQEIASWIALRKRDSNFLPSKEAMYRLYSRRLDSEFLAEQMRGIAFFSLILDTPIFFWLRDFSSDEVKELINEVWPYQNFFDKIYCLKISSFLGKTIYEKYVRKLSSSEKARLDKLKYYPREGPHSLFNPNILGHFIEQAKKKGLNVEKSFLEEITNISRDLSKDPKNWYNCHKLTSLDCRLYAPKERFKKKTTK